MQPCLFGLLRPSLEVSEKEKKIKKEDESASTRVAVATAAATKKRTKEVCHLPENELSWPTNRKGLNKDELKGTTQAAEKVHSILAASKGSTELIAELNTLYQVRT